MGPGHGHHDMDLDFDCGCHLDIDPTLPTRLTEGDWSCSSFYTEFSHIYSNSVDTSKIVLSEIIFRSLYTQTLLTHFHQRDITSFPNNPNHQPNTATLTFP